MREWWAKLLAVVRRDGLDEDLRAEVEAHLQMEVEAHVERGMSRQEALNTARRQFGNRTRIHESSREAWLFVWLETVLQDIRYGLRLLRRSPAFSTTAIVTLALGIGANTLVFSVVNALVLKPLPVTDPGRLVFVQRVGSFVSHSFPAYRDMRDRNTTFEGLAGYRITMMDVDADRRVTHEFGYLATGNYFDLLGVTPAAGRFFHPADDVTPGASPYAVLSFDYWQTRFAGRPSVVGSTIRINRRPYTVLGVAPAGFYGTEIFYRPNVWVPMTMQAQIEVGNPWLENRNTSNTWMIGRLKPTVSVAQAESDLNAILRQLAQDYSAPNEGARIALTQPGLVGEAVGGPARAFAVGVLVLAALVLITACANLASTLAARATDRRRELTIRLAIGAGRGRVLRQLVTETVVLATVGGAFGALGATIAAHALSRWQLPIALPVQLDVNPDARVFLFACLASLVAGFGFGLAPARHVTTTDPNAALKSRDGRHGSRWPMRDVLVGVQVCVCFVLVATCLIALRGLQHAATMPLGFDPAGVTMASFDLGLAGHSRETGEHLRQRALNTISALPGVQRAAYANSLPLNIDQSSTVVFPDDWPNRPRGEALRAIKYQVSPGFFETLGIHVRQGRDLDWWDTATSRRVAVVNDAFARQILRGRTVVGRHFRYGPQLIEVVGVVETGKYQSLTESETPVIFEPMLQAYNTTTVLLVRSSRSPSDLAGEIQRVMRSLDPAMPLFGVRPVEEMLGFVRLPMRIAASALSAFGLLAVVLAATGIFGVVAYAVSRRRREIAIRVAVGASQGSILQLVLRRLGTVIATGAGLGFALALSAGELLRTIVYQASPNDALSLGAAGLIVVLLATGACWVPARWALRVEPARVLSAD